MDKLLAIQKALEAIPLALKGILLAVAALAFIVGGVMMFGGRKGRESGKEQIQWVCIGIGCVCAAIPVTSWIFSLLSF